MEMGQAIRRANGRVGGKPRAMRGIVKAVRRPHRFARCRFARATGPAVSQCFRAAQCYWTGRKACDAFASPRHALLAENLGKPSLWVINSAPWYYTNRLLVPQAR